MHTAWIGIFGATLLLTAACEEATADDQTQLDTSASTQGVDSDSVATSGAASTADTPNTLGYGWTTKIAATKANGFRQDFSIQDIVANPTVRVRKDNLACTTCHSWASFSGRQSFCDRVDAFEAEPTLEGDGTDPPSAKPAYLKAVLKQWKAAGCPN